MTTSPSDHDILMVPERDQHATVAPERDANVFVVLAEQARRHSTGELATTAVGGIINAAFLAQRTSLWWLAAAYLAVSAYGTWGLLDQWSVRLQKRDAPSRLGRRALGMGQLTVTALGVLAVMAAVGGFMGAALGGWIL